MKIRTKYIIILVIVLILGLLYTGYRFGHSRGESASQALIDSQNAQIQNYLTEIGGNVTYISQKEQEVKTQRQAIRDSELKREELRKLNLKQANEITRLTLRIDTLLKNVAHNGQVIQVLNAQIVNYKPANDSLKSRPAILLPFSFKKSDQWLSLTGTFNSQGILDIRLKKDLFVDVWSGVDKATKTLKSVVSTTDPYIGVINIQSTKFDLPKPKRYGVGVFVGYGVGNKGLTPVVGVGLSYNIIRF